MTVVSCGVLTTSHGRCVSHAVREHRLSQPPPASLVGHDPLDPRERRARALASGRAPPHPPALGTSINAVVPAADGQWLYAGILEGESTRVVRAPAAAPAAPERLPLPPVAEFHLNATHLAYTRPGRTGASLCRLADLACAALIAREYPPRG